MPYLYHQQADAAPAPEGANKVDAAARRVSEKLKKAALQAAAPFRLSADSSVRLFAYVSGALKAREKLLPDGEQGWRGSKGTGKEYTAEFHIYMHGLAYISVYAWMR